METKNSSPLAKKRIEMATHSLLELFAKKSSKKEYLDSVVQVIAEWTGCRCVGIRLLSPSGYIPYESQIGFSPAFLELENMLSIERDMCACIRVITGKIATPDKVAMSPLGSFYTNDSLVFLNNMSESEAAMFRGTCIKTGFLSIAIIPIRYRDETIGAIHLADERKDLIPLKIVSHLESMAFLIGEAVHRFNLEEALKESEKKYSIMVENSLTGLYINQDGKYVYANKIFAEIHGYSLEEIIGVEYWRLVHPEDRAFVEEIRKKRLRDEEAPSEYETRDITKDGEIIWVLRRNTRIEYNGRPAIMGNMADFTQRKRAEEKLKNNNQMLEDFTRIASHDLQEPIRKIRTFAERLKSKEQQNLTDHGQDYLDRLLKSCHRMETLLRALLEFSRVSTKPQTFASVDLTQLAKEAVSDLEIAIEKANGTVHIAQLATIDADSHQIRQLFQNLVGNALRYHEERSPVVKVYGEFAKKGAKNLYRIFIEDNGIGFDERYLDRIFNPFERLHGRCEFEGTGMGLAICKKIVEKHGGAITAKSKPGAGSTFIVDLPLHRDNPSSDSAFNHERRDD